jgi:hypothetical protein
VSRRDAARQVDEVADRVALAEGQEGFAVGDVQGFHRDPAGQERRDFAAPVGRHDHVVAEVEERAGGVGADHAEPAGDEDHRARLGTLFRGFLNESRRNGR